MISMGRKTRSAKATEQDRRTRRASDRIGKPDRERTAYEQRVHKVGPRTACDPLLLGV
jgi:hypothetical protein